MKLGIVTPVLTRLPGRHAQWEEAAGIDDVVTVAVEAERLGYHHVTCSEHVARAASTSPRSAAGRTGTRSRRSATSPPAPPRSASRRTCSCSATTTRSRSRSATARSTGVERPAGARGRRRHPRGGVRAARRASSPDRGDRADDATPRVACLALEPEPEYHGEFYDFEGFVVDPRALQPRVPIWIGGQTCAVAAPGGRARRRVGAVRAAPGRAGRDDRATSTCRPGSSSCSRTRCRSTPPPSPSVCGRPLGASSRPAPRCVNVRFVHHSLEHYLEQLAAMRALVD